MAEKRYLAFDFGAESGRAILGTLNNDKLTIEELHRFPTGMLVFNGHLHWNIYRFYEELIKSLKIVASRKIKIDSIAFDTWGVDFALLAKDGTILGLPFAYRDARNDGADEAFFKIMPREKVYKLTGIQIMQLNSLYQLYAMKQDDSTLLDQTKDLLFIADVFNYMFTGEKKTEYTFATTSQLLNPATKNWEPELFKKLDIPIEIMQEIIQPGQIIGKLTPQLAKETGLEQVPVAAVGSHDTASAVAAVPAENNNFVYISSGTWSLMGIETSEAIVNSKALNYNLTNEGGVEGTYRFLKNIMGLWLLQRCKKDWENQKKYTYPELVEIGSKAQPFKCLIDPDDPSFINPDNMPEAIAAYCKATGQKPPANHGETVRCVMESLAFKYRYTLDLLKDISPHPIEKIHIIGGGGQNKQLSQFTANAGGIPVVVGPSEATATGNLLMQALAMGDVNSLSQIREIVRNSFDLEVYQPDNPDEWENAYQTFLTIIKK